MCYAMCIWMCRQGFSYTGYVRRAPVSAFFIWNQCLKLFVLLVRKISIFQFILLLIIHASLNKYILINLIS